MQTLTVDYILLHKAENIRFTMFITCWPRAIVGFSRTTNFRFT